MEDIDRKLREAYTGNLVDTRGLERAILGEIRRQSCRRRALRSAAGAMLVVALLGYWFARRSLEPKIYRDAALDHQAEVIQKSPRRWLTTDSELDALTTRFGLSRQRVALSGYRLLRAKICILDRQRVLHLVYRGGDNEFSLFLLAGNKHVLSGETRGGAVSIEGFETAHTAGLVVSDAPTAECRRFTQAALAILKG